MCFKTSLNINKLILLGVMIFFKVLPVMYAMIVNNRLRAADNITNAEGREQIAKSSGEWIVRKADDRRSEVGAVGKSGMRMQ